MFHALMIAGVGAGFALLRSRRRLPDGQRPFDAFPDGVVREPLRSEVVTVSSGRRYKVTSFASIDGRTYYVAELRGDVDWLSYLQAPGNPDRELWGANADRVEDVAAMRRDFNVSIEGGAS